MPGTEQSPPAPAVLTPEQARRAGRSPRDVALSLAALIVPILLLLGAYRLFWNGDKPIAVDVSETYQTAQHAGAFPVLEPAGLGSGWSANVANFVPASPGAGGAAAGAVLRVVYHDPDGDGVQLIETNAPSDAVLAAELGTDARPGNLVTLGGRQWREYPVAGSGARALAAVEDGRVVIVIGSASADRLREFAAALP